MQLYLASLGAAGAGAVLGAALPRGARSLAAALLTAAACVAALVAAAGVLASGRTWSLHVAAVLPLAGVDLSLDPLGALFVAVTAAVGLAVTIYGAGDASHGPAGRTATGAVPAFLASMLLVPAAASVTTFALAWELMAVTSLLLVLAGHGRRAETREAAQWYGAMTHLGAAAIVLGLLLLAAKAGGQTFADIATHRAAVSPALRSTAFVLVLAGFSSKAGAVPLHVWLPRAHPEAPSAVSALMSGAMVNLGVYGIVRVGESLLGGGPSWWWLLVLGLGVASALFGALHAAACTDLKRLLAYSTVDNMGLVLVGVGAAGALADDGHRLLAALALLAAFFHVVNHALFKGCLFLGAGAVQAAAGTRDLDELGGLATRLPRTTALFAVGVLSICALPPLNGFASEWLLLQGLLHGFGGQPGPTAVGLLAGVAALALTGGLTAAAFVKAFGIGFLGQPRTSGAAGAREVAPAMVVGTGILAVACVALGVAPGSLLPALDRATAAALPAGAPAPLRPGLGLELAGLRGAIEPALVAAGLLVGVAVAWAGTRLVTRRSALRSPRRAEAWGCGRELQTPRMAYTATSFAEPLQRVFADVLRPDHDLEVTHADESRYVLRTARFRTRTDDGIERGLYWPVIGAVAAWGRLARRLPNGSVHRYLAIGFTALVVALVVLA